MFPRDRGLEGVEVDILAVVVSVEEAADDLGADADGDLGLRLGRSGRHSCLCVSLVKKLSDETERQR